MQKRSFHYRVLGILTALVTLAAAHAQAGEVGPITIAKQGYFFVGGKYVEAPGEPVLAGHAYVEYQIPQTRTQPFPIVMIHGCCSAGSSWSGTPDGRDGWAQYFLSKGYAVYIMDQVGRGRAAYVDSVYGQNNPKAPKFVEREFIAYERYNLFPQAKLHTQWPGAGVVGDPLFDQFQAMMEPDFKDRTLREVLNRAAGDALLDRIGPAIIMAHSQAGIYAWGIANDRPQLVKGMVMVEAAGSAFHEIALKGPPDWFKDEGMSKPWGFTRTPVDYDPPLAPKQELAIAQQEKADAPDLARCWRQQEPARKLPKLAGIPIMLLHGEASFAMPTAHCGAAFLTQAGVPNDFVKLADLGIHGNGHFMMLEKNNLDVAAVIADWLARRVPPVGAASGHQK
ncbi:MAG: alpha/beta-hydrolase [Hyphomicrobiales bacterium]|jgi:pimeloyl-ACP methyl ester carboxylesterase|nr:alpha/beta-hydrolase [Hyphomicrobiales bacterium]